MPRNLFYRHKPIGSITALCRALGIAGMSPRHLSHLAQTADDFYRVAKEIPKEDGVRTVYDVRPSLKEIQQAVHNRIFSAAIYPSYLSGGIKGRSTKSHAQPHVGAEILVNEDISNFFPSITTAQVQDLFIYGFSFAPEVGKMLALLLTFQGKVPQGAPTSGDIANLILFKSEPLLVQELRSRGFEYGRFIDDISLSTHQRDIDETELTAAISSVISLIQSPGLRVNRKKHSIARSGKQMTTVGHLVNRKLSISRGYEKTAWIAVVHTEKLAKEQPGSPETEKAFKSARGKVIHLANARPRRADPLQRRIKALKIELSLR